MGPAVQLVVICISIGFILFVTVLHVVGKVSIGDACPLPPFSAPSYTLAWHQAKKTTAALGPPETLFKLHCQHRL